jgi:acyl-[acyl carrier protein]--UDP-N-acetylglucosamine O-acyltransferase
MRGLKRLGISQKSVLRIRGFYKGLYSRLLHF